MYSMVMSYEYQYNKKRINRIIVIAIIATITIVLMANSIKIVDAGHRGVLLHWQEIDGVSKTPDGLWITTKAPLKEGLHFVVPFQDQIIPMEVRTTKFIKTATAASQDLQTVSTTVEINYHVSAEIVNVLYASVGLDFPARIIQPAVDETVKQVTANYNAEELITKRPLVKADIEHALAGRLAKFSIIQDVVSITDFEFSPLFNDAIESKVEALQKALKAENDLQRIRIEAQQVEAAAIGVANANIAQANGESEAILIINKALLNSPEYLEWLKTQKWDGMLPKVTGGAIPFVEIPMEDSQP